MTRALLPLILISLPLIAYRYRGLFLLNDVTTTPDAHPEFNRPGMAFTEESKRLNKQFYSDLYPLRFREPPEELYQRALRAAQEMPDWKIVKKGHGKIEAVARTKLMGFEDDVLIEVRSENHYSTLNIRSKSRIGKGDLGTNYRRIKHYIEKLKYEPNRRPPPP